ncbi:MAG TPA: hypothetical protein VNX46_17135, partial [Candidatus Acidoferrum sp.]|nr:hypothetical protein [Candidatus Acidoferrum sp.]
NFSAFVGGDLAGIAHSKGRGDVFQARGDQADLVALVFDLRLPVFLRALRSRQQVYIASLARASHFSSRRNCSRVSVEKHFVLLRAG